LIDGFDNEKEKVNVACRDVWQVDTERLNDDDEGTMMSVMTLIGAVGCDGVFDPVLIYHSTSTSATLTC